MLTSRNAVNTRLSPGCRKPDSPDLPSDPSRTQARRRAETVTDSGVDVLVAANDAGGAVDGVGVTAAADAVAAGPADGDAVRSIGAGATSSLALRTSETAVRRVGQLT